MRSSLKSTLYLVLIILLLPHFSPAQQWRFISSPNQGSLRNELTGVDGLSDNEVWAVGSYDTVVSTISRTWTLIEKWDGASWTIVPSPNPNTMANFLISVKAITSNNIYAVGSSAGIPATSQMMILHWNGNIWATESTPIITGGSSLYGIDAVAPDNVWAVGDRNIGAPGPDIGTLTMHWNGISWDTISSPNVANRWNSLYSIQAISPDNIWAVGYSRELTGNFQPLIEHWNGSSWNVVTSPSQGFESFLYSVAVISANDIWATGVYNNGSTFVPLFMHWNGSDWSIVNSPAGGSSTSFIDAFNGWSVGGSIARWNGSEWIDVQAPVPVDGSLKGLTIISPANAWAVGRLTSNGIGQTLTMHYENVTLVELSNSAHPYGYMLAQNYPNPFNPSTMIKYSITQSSRVEMRVYDIVGREVATLVNEEKSAGIYEVEFDAFELPSGTYFYQLRTKDFIETKKMVLLK